MIARPSLRVAALLAGALALGSAGCAAASPDQASESELQAAEGEALAAALFVRSDQVDYGRAPLNTGDLQGLVNEDFSSPTASADKVVAWIEAHPSYAHPIYLGNIHTWIYDTNATYRQDVAVLATRIHKATKHPVLFYFEEENATHPAHPVSVAHAPALRALAANAKLLCATYANGQQDHAEVVATVKRWKTWYAGTLGVPLEAMLIDMDTSQTPVGAYYGSRGDLANFDHVVGWALVTAYNQGFGGFHTMGNGPAAKYGTKQAADATYEALNNAWDALVTAHPKQAFTGL